MLFGNAKKSVDVDIYYVVYPSKHPWCSDFAVNAINLYSKFSVMPLDIGYVSKYGGKIIHFHNIQLLKFVDLEKVKKRYEAVVAGVRGKIGLEQMKNYIHKLDAVAVNIDPTLRNDVEILHPKVFVIPEGVDTNFFKPHYNVLNDFTVGWVGRDHKNFKNSDLLPSLGYGYKKATYNEYIPHYKMPDFYADTNVLVNLSEHEGFCRPILEAASCGLPVISSDVGVSRCILDDEWIIEGNPRRNIDEYKNKLNLLKNNQVLIKKTGFDNRKRALKFDWKQVVPQYDGMWEDILVGDVLDQASAIQLQSIVQ